MAVIAQYHRVKPTYGRRYLAVAAGTIRRTVRRDVAYLRTRTMTDEVPVVHRKSKWKIVRLYRAMVRTYRFLWLHRIGLAPWYLGTAALIAFTYRYGFPAYGDLRYWALGTLLLSIPWYRYRMVRRGVRVDRTALHGTERWSAMRTARRIVKYWDVHMRNADMVGTGLKAVTFDEWSMVMDLRTTHRHGTTEVRKKIEVLERCFDGTRFTVRRNSGRTEPLGEHARGVRVRFMLRDPHALPIAPPVPDGTSHLVPIGLFETGTEVLIDILQHVLIAGRTNAGKSTLLQVLIRALTRIPWVAVVGLDMKPGAPELGRWDGKLAYIGRNANDAEAVLDGLIEGLESRGLKMAERGWQKWKPSRDEPHIVLLVDEAQEIQEAGLGPKLSRVAALLRAYGGTLVLATQYPKDKNLPATVKQQMTQVVGLKTRDAVADRVIFGQDADKEGWSAHKLTIHRFYIQSDTYVTPIVAKGYYLDDDDLPRAVKEAPAATLVDAGTLALGSTVCEPETAAVAVLGHGRDPDTWEAEIVPDDALERVYMAVKDVETHRTDIETETGFTQKTVDKYLKVLIRKGAVVKVRRAWYRRT